jgi:hypothetical protein
MIGSSGSSAASLGRFANHAFSSASNRLLIPRAPPPARAKEEAHHAAPASGARYAIDSQFTKAIRGLVDQFEHRLFLTATPHNGHTRTIGDARSPRT